MHAFDLFTLDERRTALQAFAMLKYPHIEDRFIEAVHATIQAQRVLSDEPRQESS